MMEVELRTARGEPIGRFNIPPFPDPPPVLLWGERVFEWTSFDTTYREVAESSTNVFTYRIVSRMK